MTNQPDPRRSAESISTEIGLELSYFTDESERNFLPLGLPIGYLLLQWFAEGLVMGVGATASESLTDKVAVAVKGLRTRVSRLFGRRSETPQTDARAEEELAIDTKEALDVAREQFGGGSGDDLTRAAEAYEQALVGYLTGEGMPAVDAVRIAQRVRSEAGIQLRLGWSGG